MITDENNNLPTTSSLNRSKDLHLDRSKKKVLLNTPISPVSRTNFFSKKKTIDINSRFIKIWIENLIGTAYEVINFDLVFKFYRSTFEFSRYFF